MPNHVAKRRTSGSPWRYLAPWYLAYAILGLITAGMLPFLMPLMVASTTGEPSRAAYVIAGYNIGLLAAPLLGKLAQHYQLFRPVFFGGFVALTLGLGAATQISALAGWVPLALLCGAGAGAVATVAPLFVIDFAPKEEWDARIGWLQSFSSGGQLAGFLIEGLIAQESLAYGFWVAAGLSALAILVGHFGLPSVKHGHRMRLPPLRWGQLMGGFHSGPLVGGLLHHSHNLQGEAWRSLPRSLGGAFGRFLLAWAAIHFGVAPFFAYYPLIMNDIYDTPPSNDGLALCPGSDRRHRAVRAGRPCSAAIRGSAHLSARPGSTDGRLRGTGSSGPSRVSERAGYGHVGFHIGDTCVARSQRFRYRARRANGTTGWRRRRDGSVGGQQRGCHPAGHRSDRTAGGGVRLSGAPADCHHWSFVRGRPDVEARSIRGSRAHARRASGFRSELTASATASASAERP
jgi:hypothetical protein